MFPFMHGVPDVCRLRGDPDDTLRSRETHAGTQALGGPLNPSAQGKPACRAPGGALIVGTPGAAFCYLIPYPEARIR